ncbi:hypothetical protein [Chryseobacterium oranimense]
MLIIHSDWGRLKVGASETDPAEWMISKDIEIPVDVRLKNVRYRK